LLADGAPLFGRRAVDLALGRKDLVDAAHRLDGERCLSQIGQFEEFAPAMSPAGCLGDRPRTAFASYNCPNPASASACRIPV
jgi:hypothetical protein